MTSTLYTRNDCDRLRQIGDLEYYRSSFRIDYARLLHSPAFRRLQGKTQLYPGFESDFFRNRLTHSLEVAQIAKSIAIKIMCDYSHCFSKDTFGSIDLDLIEFAALAHDLGHPPFGHNGEDKLDELMKNEGGYEGNAQTLRIITHLEKKERHNTTGRPIGLNVTYRSMASILKYDSVIEKERHNRVKTKKGYYCFDEKLVQNIKIAVCGDNLLGHKFKTLECSIMDIADDIAYSVYDLEDGLKAGFLSPLDFISPDEKNCERIAEKFSMSVSNVKKNLQLLFQDFLTDTISEDGDIYETIATVYSNAKTLSANGYYRTAYTSNLIKEFMNGVKLNINNDCLALSYVEFSDEVANRVNVLKTFNYNKIIESSRLKIAEHRGKEIIAGIFNAIVDNPRLMPDDHIELYEANKASECGMNRIIADFIAGMTDRYALEFYCRLFSENPESIFKPL